MKGKKKEILTASAVLLQKFATALANVAWLVLLAELIDEVLPQKVIMRSQEKMAQYVLGLILLSVWKRIGYSLGRYLTLKLQNMVCFRLKSKIVEKTSKIPYRLLEDYAFRELKQALQESINESRDQNHCMVSCAEIGKLYAVLCQTAGNMSAIGKGSIPLGLPVFFIGSSTLYYEYAGGKGDVRCKR